MRQRLSERRFARSRLPGEKNGPPGDLSAFDHLHDNAQGSAGLQLPHKTLRLTTGLQRLVQAETANVGVSATTFN
jgi:hypothetical protein